uniref:Uncharacterized protein n=1 Tax=Oryza punctata TaxID=4537 RepID=A0A0E0LIT5_ORYPU
MAKAGVNLTVLSLSLVALLVLTAIEDVAVATQVINYASMNHDDIPGTPQLDHPGGDANKYTRGCEEEDDCRG